MSSLLDKSQTSNLKSQTSTICALATAPGGALGIIRISGPQTLEILSRIFSKDLTNAQPNTIHYGHIVEKTSNPQPQTSNLIDEVLVSIFRAPHSYTGEDSAEISCHGSRYILNKVLELLIQHGCRMANPGEYTQRAFLNGKMDLSQAEAVADLIASGNKATHQIAMSQLRGVFSSELSQLREQLLKLTSLLELELDFSDHEDLEFADRSELLDIAKKINNRIISLAQSFETGQALKNGIPVAIVGKTNVGKSTLLNRLLHDDRAIVSSVHTRLRIPSTFTVSPSDSSTLQASVRPQTRLSRLASAAPSPPSKKPASYFGSSMPSPQRKTFKRCLSAAMASHCLSSKTKSTSNPPHNLRSSLARLLPSGRKKPQTSNLKPQTS